MTFKAHGLTGANCGRWTVSSPTAFGIPYDRRGSKRYRYWVVCRCQCGNTAPVRVDQIKAGISRSCGCLQKDKASSVMRDTMTDHGQGTREWHWLLLRAHRQMRRCNDRTDRHYQWYGGRGVEFRFSSPAEAASYYRTLPNCSRRFDLDREDNNGHYEVGNVRFVTHRENMNNRF